MNFLLIPKEDRFLIPHCAVKHRQYIGNYYSEQESKTPIYSRKEFSAKTHTTVDALSNPLRFHMTGQLACELVLSHLS